MSLLLYLFTFVTRTFIALSKFVGGGGTALPGLWIEKYFPWILSKYSSFYSEIVLITGTNGKTTTQLLLRHVLEKNGICCLSNTSGSNMFRGIASAVVGYGLPKNKNTVLILEVEEGTMPKIAPYISPSKLIITNFFRDQLDAYGELSKTVEYVKKAVYEWPKVVLYANIDDPKVGDLLKELPNERKTYSMGEYSRKFMYEGVLQKAGSDVVCESVDIKNMSETDLLLKIAESADKASKNTRTLVKSPLSGLYNVYNLMAALLVSRDLGINHEIFSKSIYDLKTPFGRGEELIVKKADKTIKFQIFLIKNPAGMTQVWEMINERVIDKGCIIALNDNIADGRDVSWIWDAKIENEQNVNGKLYFTGIRAYDMALRFKYAGYVVEEENVFDKIPELITHVVDKVEKNTDELRSYYVLATYTAMNEFRGVLAKYTNVTKYS